MTDSLQLKEKIGYSFGDFASSMFWKIFSMFLMYYYTDIVDLSPESVGTMLLLTRLWDGINDPIMGMIADRTQTKQGKFRPYLLWGAVPFALIGIITFSMPGFGPGGKLVYAYITYTLMMMIYTVVNVPYASLLGVMTDKPCERTSLSSFRFIGAYAGGMLMTASIPLLLQFFKSMNFSDARGFQFSVIIYAIIAAFFFIMTYAWTSERLKPVAEKNRIKNDLKDLATNGQWFIMLGACVAVLIFNSLRDGSIQYYFKYYIQERELPLFGKVAWEKLSGAYMTIWLGSNMLGVLLANPVSARIGKRTTFIYAMALAALLSIWLYFLTPAQLVLIFGLNVLIGLTAGVVLPLIWSMYADISDYSEHRTGRRATGLIFSSSSMSQKMGWTLGGAVTGWILSAYGFEANAVQSNESITGIRMLISIYPAAGAGIAVLFLLAYRLSDSFMEQITRELRERRQK